MAVLEAAAAAAPAAAPVEARERAHDAALAAAEDAAADAGAALTEMAAVLAGREAAHAALVETVRALVVQGVPGAGETPGATPAATPRGEEREAERFGELTAYWSERLEAQAREAMARLRAPAGGGDLPSADGSAGGSDDDGSEGAPTPRTAAPKAAPRVPPLAHAAKALAPWTPPHALAE